MNSFRFILSNKIYFKNLVDFRTPDTWHQNDNYTKCNRDDRLHCYKICILYSSEKIILHFISFPDPDSHHIRFPTIAYVHVVSRPRQSGFVVRVCCLIIYPLTPISNKSLLIISSYWMCLNLMRNLYFF